MTRTLVVLAALGGLTMSSALAQAPQSPAAPANSPAASTAKPSGAQIVNAQSKDEWLASKLKGMTILGSDDQKIGSVVDILIDKTGQAKALVVGVGGVLGLGAKEVAVDWGQFHEMPGASENQKQLKLGMTKDQLAQADEFKPLPSPATTTGAAPGGSRPAGSPTGAPPR
jgi:sporulation protein YlmC with PRC-barrel domain